jgi:glycosyltransferase involved in cell wall biosynthesis
MNQLEIITLIRGSGLFDDRFYLEKYPEAIESDLTLVEHYLKYGVERGLNPSPFFHTTYYLAHNPEAIRAGIHPLVHYLTVGAIEGRLPKAPGTPKELTDLTLQSKTIAFYLPQYHPIPENDQWWGKGFTEWTNVTAATPSFATHDQPRLPSEFGFYDLRLPDIYPQQVALAREYGIDGFCYYYYWFNGRRLLERPLNDMLQRPDIDFPFCICWANESWSRRWDGRDREILLNQDHTVAGDNRFIQDVLPILQDPRYIKVDGKPMLLVYRPELMANPVVTARVWRQAAIDGGLPGLHICAVQFEITDPRLVAFDALVEFPPHFLPNYDITGVVPQISGDFLGKICDYYAGMLTLLDRPRPDFPLYRGAMLAWDNTPRRKNRALIFHYSSPEAYRQWLRRLLLQAPENAHAAESFVFINAWNEWAEGATLEPSQHQGRAFLEATRDARNPALSTAYIEETAYRVYRQALEKECRCDDSPKAIEQQRDSLSAHPRVTWVSSQADRAGKLETAQHGILLVSHDAAPAGAQWVLVEILKTLAQCQTVAVYILLCGGGELEPEFYRWGMVFNLETLTGEGLSRSEAIATVLADLESRAIDLAICNTIVTHDVARALHSAGIPVLALLHELPTSVEMYAGSSALGKMVEAARDVIVVSEAMKQQLSSRYGIPSDRFTVIYPGVRADLDAGEPRSETRALVQEEFHFPADSFLVLGSGSIHPRKGCDLFAQIARKLLSSPDTDKIRFLWIGAAQDESGFRSWCEHDLAALGLSDKVIFAGARPSLLPYLAAADVFLLPSREDPFPQVALEAMYNGLPVVAFEGAGGIPEALSDDAGVLVPYLDILTMAEKVRQFSQDPLWRKRVGMKARSKGREAYTWERYRRDLFDFLQKNYSLCLS